LQRFLRRPPKRRTQGRVAEIVRLGDAPYPASGHDQLVFYLPDTVAQERVMARLAAAGVRPIAQIDYWGTTAALPTRTQTGEKSSSPPGPIARPPDSRGSGDRRCV